MSRVTSLMLIFYACGMLWAAEPGGAASFDDYKDIYEKNIFSRLRTPSGGAGDTGLVSTERVVLSLYVLRGVAIEPGSRLAFVEDEISGQSKRLAAGDALLNGVIEEILPDRVVFKANDQARDVRIGQEFDRVESLVERAADAPADAPEAAPDPNRVRPVPAVQKSPAGAPSQDEAEILRQLMERRKKELES